MDEKTPGEADSPGVFSFTAIQALLFTFFYCFVHFMDFLHHAESRSHSGCLKSEFRDFKTEM